MCPTAHAEPKMEVARQTLRFAIREAISMYKLGCFRVGGGKRHLREIRGVLAVDSANLTQGMIERPVANLEPADARKRTIRSLNSYPSFRTSQARPKITPIHPDKCKRRTKGFAASKKSMDSRSSRTEIQSGGSESQE